MAYSISSCKSFIHNAYMSKDEMSGTTPKAWIQEGKKDLDLLVEYGPEQYLKQERSRTQNRGMHL